MAVLGSKSNISVMLGNDLVKLDITEATIKGSRKTDTKYVLGRSSPLYLQSDPEFEGSLTVLHNSESQKIQDAYYSQGDLEKILIELQDSVNGRTYIYEDVVITNLDLGRISSQDVRSLIISFKAGTLTIEG